MPLVMHAESHRDHALTEAQIAWALAQCADRDGKFVATFTMPEELGTAPCALYGPIMGDPPVVGGRCGPHRTYWAKRGDRPYSSRMLDAPLRPVRALTVIGGPHGDAPCVVYTMFGGPVAPQEPNDPNREVSWEESYEFWRLHALADGHVPLMRDDIQ